jgi:plasmid stabilization system protein ParE
MRVKWRVRALRELDALLEYVSTENPAAAKAIALGIEETISHLSVFPELGHPTNVAGVRTKLIPGYPYRLFYTIAEDRREIGILRVRDVRRRPIYGGSPADRI